MYEFYYKDFLIMRRIIFALFIVIFVVPALAEQSRPDVQLIQGDNKIDVMVGGTLFTSYLYESRLTIPQGVWEKLIDKRLYIS
jgi:hypothetical protein